MSRHNQSRACRFVRLLLIGMVRSLSMMSSYVGWDCWGPDPNISDEDAKMKKNNFSNAFRVACFESGFATRALPAFPDESAG